MKKLFAICAAVFAIALSAYAQGVTSEKTMYAVYNEESSTLTFYYDLKRDIRAGEGKVFCYNPDADYNHSDGGRHGWTEVNWSVKTAIFHESFRAARPKNLSGWFMGFERLERIEGLGFLNTCEADTMESMFEDCRELESLDLSGFNTANVKNMSKMFCECRELESLNLLSFDTGNVDDMVFMFSRCKSLTMVDLSSFSVGSRTNLGCMFQGCESLETIYVGANGIWSFEMEDESLETVEASLAGFLKNEYRAGHMFSSCPKLKGGQGSSYSSNQKLDRVLARVDGGPSCPGLFTAVSGYPSSITLDNSSIFFYGESGRPMALKATVGPANAVYKNVTWASDNTEVATVNHGLVTPGKYGTATITATTVNGIFATCTVTVKDADVVKARSISFPQTDYYLSPGQTVSLGLILDPLYANDFTVSSTMPSVVEVSADGKSITAKENGNCRLVVRWTDPDGLNKTAVARVEVR